MTRWWPPIRAALIALAIALGLLDGCPRRYVDTSRARHAILDRAPFRWFGEFTHAGQEWRLFAGANKARYRLWIEARASASVPWDVLYREFDAAHALLADQMLYRRMRGAWAPRGSRGPRGAYPAFASAVARVVFAQWPAYQEVRVRMEPVAVGERGGDTFSGGVVYAVTRTRAQIDAELAHAAKAARAPAEDEVHE